MRGKPARFVWSRGKAGDNFKCLPIANNYLVSGNIMGGVLLESEVKKDLTKIISVTVGGVILILLVPVLFAYL